MNKTKSPCRFAVVLLKSNGERKVIKCCVGVPDYGFYTNGEHRLGHRDRIGREIHVDPDTPHHVIRGNLLCGFNLWLESEYTGVISTYCPLGPGHDGFHLLGRMKGFHAWERAEVRVYRNLTESMLDTRSGFNFAVGGKNPLGLGLIPLPKYTPPPKVLPPPPDLLGDAKSSVRLHARRLLECWDEVIKNETDPRFLTLLEQGKVKLVGDLAPVFGDPYFARKVVA